MVYKLKYIYVMFMGYFITYKNILLVKLFRIFKKKKYDELSNYLYSIVSKSKSKL